MDSNVIKSVYFLGIGGIGMSAIARYFLQQGISVAGYDKSPTTLTDQLIREGMEIHFNEDLSAIPADVELVIRTPAVPAEHAEYRYFLENDIPVRKRAEILGEIASPFTTIAVAGTHGKTTITTMIAHIFHTVGKPMLAFLGGISKNYGTNFVQLEVIKEQAQRHQGMKAQRHEGTDSQTHNCHVATLLATRLTNSPLPRRYAPRNKTHKLTNSPPHHLTTCIVEADEFDRSFLHLSPDIAIITSVDADHLDVYSHPDKLRHSFEDFAGRIRKSGSLIMKKGVDIPVERSERISIFSYSTGSEADFYATNVTLNAGLIHFDFITPEKTLPGFILGMPGLFNLENAIAAMAAGWISGIEEEDLRSAMRCFEGVVRRFDIRISRNDFVYIDDYAHHPEELRACIEAVRKLYPGKHVTGVFQPHLYSRTRDLADDFARVLAELDALILLEIYPARELPIEGINSGMLLDKVNLSDKQLCRRDNLTDILEERHPEVLLTLGAGDIDKLVEPITERFSSE